MIKMQNCSKLECHCRSLPDDTEKKPMVVEVFCLKVNN